MITRAELHEIDQRRSQQDLIDLLPHVHELFDLCQAHGLVDPDPVLDPETGEPLVPELDPEPAPAPPKAPAKRKPARKPVRRLGRKAKA